ncbi:hypothetical protein [Streptomyces ficellus]|uniref:DUF5642 domain-containing protein n=1 Tax=Streptomyces ficellus TaxID=1977088 RepID=A0A6I6FNC9_9ACTN|nr:hypothetical protein [Streptomyces ficellus]QGV80709.1 hypothetical protein EIZ62_22570 [Streptomyces ficellus]
MRTRIRRGVAVALTVSALTFTAACGGGSSDKGDDSAAKGKDKAAEQPADKPAAATPLTAAQMKAGTLTVADLPKGWVSMKNPASTDEVPKADKPECQPIADLMHDKIAGATMGANADFTGGNGANQLTHQVMTFPGTGAADFVTPIGEASEKCTGFKTTMEGAPVELKVAKLAAPKTGEESHGVRVSMDLGGAMEFALNVVVARQGSGVSRLVFLPGTPDAAKELDDLAKRAGDKFVEAAQG